MTYLGTIRNGVVELEQDINLPEGTVVQILPVEASSAADEEAIPSLFKIGRTAGNTGIPDLATNIDHYLYGHPKVCDGR